MNPLPVKGRAGEGMGFRDAAATFRQTHPHLNPPLEGEDFKAKGKRLSMSDTTSLLIELGTEELPVKALPGLAQALFDGVIDALGKRGIAVRSEERRVGKEGVSTWRARWWP